MLKDHSKFFLLFLFVLVQFNITNAQQDWHRGYILKTKTDTVYGYIDNRGSKTNTTQCNFKETKDGEIHNFTPDELFGYRFIGGEYYVSRILNFNSVEIPVFYEFLINGIVNVYHSFYEQSRYFLEKNGKLYELKNTKKIEEKDYQKFEVTKKEYIGILTVLLADGDLMPQIQSTNFSANSLIKIAEKYHQKVCDGEACIVYKRERVKDDGRFKFSLYGGARGTKFNFGGFTESDICYGSQIGVRLEYCDVFIWAKNFSIELDINLQNYTKCTLHEVGNESSSYITYNEQDYLITTVSYYNNPLNSLDVNLKMTSINIPVFVNYVFLKGNIRPYIGAGIANNIVIQQNEKFIYQRFQDVYGQSIPKYSNGIILKAGSKFKVKNNELFIEFGYEGTKTYDAINSTQLNADSYFLLCGITF